MMGASHAATGAAAWLAVAGTAPLTLGVLDGVDGPGLAAGALVCAGAALLPDADHHNATIAHALPPVTNAIATGVGKISGGHRHGTHSLLALACVTAGAAGLAQLDVHAGPLGAVAWGAGLGTLVLAALATKALKITRGTSSAWILSLAAAVVVVLAAPADRAWFPVAVGLGFAVHIAGDMLTTGGVPLAWPWVPKPPRALRHLPVVSAVWKPNGHLAVPVLGNAGSWREWLLVSVMSVWFVVVVVMEAAGTTAAELGAILGGRA